MLLVLDCIQIGQPRQNITLSGSTYPRMQGSCPHWKSSFLLLTLPFKKMDARSVIAAGNSDRLMIVDAEAGGWTLEDKKEKTNNVSILFLTCQSMKYFLRILYRPACLPISGCLCLLVFCSCLSVADLSTCCTDRQRMRTSPSCTLSLLPCVSVLLHRLLISDALRCLLTRLTNTAVLLTAQRIRFAPAMQCVFLCKYIFG